MAAGQAPETLQAHASIMHIACSGLFDASDGTASRCKRISPLPPGLNQRAALLTAPLFNAKTAGVLKEVGGAPRGTRRPDSVPPMGCGSSARLAATPFALRRPANQSLGTPFDRPPPLSTGRPTRKWATKRAGNRPFDRPGSSRKERAETSLLSHFCAT